VAHHRGKTIENEEFDVDTFGAPLAFERVPCRTRIILAEGCVQRLFSDNIPRSRLTGAPFPVSFRKSS